MCVYICACVYMRSVVLVQELEILWTFFFNLLQRYLHTSTFCRIFSFVSEVELTLFLISLLNKFWIKKTDKSWFIFLSVYL